MYAQQPRGVKGLRCAGCCYFTIFFARAISLALSQQHALHTPFWLRAREPRNSAPHQIYTRTHTITTTGELLVANNRRRDPRSPLYVHIYVYILCKCVGRQCAWVYAFSPCLYDNKEKDMEKIQHYFPASRLLPPSLVRNSHRIREYSASMAVVAVVVVVFIHQARHPSGESVAATDGVRKSSFIPILYREKKPIARIACAWCVPRAQQYGRSRALYADRRFAVFSLTACQ